MKIAFIDVNAGHKLGGQFASQGSLLISPLLRQAGHSVKTVLLPKRAYNREEIEQLHEIVEDVDLVMIAVYTPSADQAIQVTEFVHRKYPEMNVIWGGPHCVASPDISLHYADGVCFSEGDKCVVDFVSKLEKNDRDYIRTPNMAFKIKDTTVVNDVLPPFNDLDSLPFLDYNYTDKYLLEDHLIPLSKENTKEFFTSYPLYRPNFYILTSRGCPHQCSYCNNCRYVSMFGKNRVRFQSVNRFIDELKIHLNNLDFIEVVTFADDDFFVRSTRQLEEFAQRYKKEINLPFLVAVSANTYRKEKMDILIEAGLMGVQMGVQSGSQRVLDEVYNRRIKVAKTRDVVREIEPYIRTRSLRFFLDFIIDNPYETKDDIIQTYRYISELPSQVQLNMFCLVFFPGTPLYNRAINDGIIETYGTSVLKSLTDWYSSGIEYQKNYETLLVILLNSLRRYVPRFIWRILGSSLVRTAATALPKSFYGSIIKLFQNRILPILGYIKQIMWRK